MRTTANCSSFNGTLVTIQSIIDKLPSGYNRDLQLTKEPFMKGVAITISTINIMTLIVDNLEINVENIKKACTPELYATDEAYKLVKEEGIPFREAYAIVAQKYK